MVEVFLQINHQIPWMPLNYQLPQLAYLYPFLILQNQMDQPSFMVILIIELLGAIHKLVASWVGGRTQFAAITTALATTKHPFPYSLAWERRENSILVHFLSSTADIHYYHISLLMVSLIATMNIGQLLAPKMYFQLIQHYHFWY